MTDLQRFIAAQDGVYQLALAELIRGRKESHWMWFIFPQLAGLGRSAMAQHYAIRSLGEARGYLAHPLLGPRLAECVDAVLVHRQRSAEQIFGAVDAMKFRSSMTLFDAAGGEARGGEARFGAALDAFFGGLKDPATLHLLRI
jgi:uncharacterized protein (DUF1810 family)